ncbi:MAG: recombinase family protein [Turicibacter sp.]|nr:recombinase family protein [Turicibacter sp.]
MAKIYGYSRISTNKQSITRQNRNILELYPTAIIKEEVFTGTTTDRPVWTKLLKDIKAGDTIVFDSVSRMSRNAEEGVKEYLELYDLGVTLVFIKEPHINTNTYKKALNVDLGIETDNEVLKPILNGVKKALEVLATQQIQIAFEQSEKEVNDLSQRTVEGLITAKANGKILGRRVGSKIETKKAIENKAKIIKLSKSFNGTLKDTEVLELLNIDRGTYYRYKKQIKAELSERE